MYNNQYYPYQYGMNPQYQRPMVAQDQPVAPVQQYSPIVSPNYIKGRPVVSIDEAKASQIDLDGSLYVFPDLGNKRIYTKQINLDGTAAFHVFTLDDAAMPAPSQPQTQDYVTKAELEAIITELKASFAKPDTTKTKASAPTFNL